MIKQVGKKLWLFKEDATGFQIVGRFSEIMRIRGSFLQLMKNKGLHHERQT